MMRASIIVVTYNGERWLDACLAALEADVPPDGEIVVVDNASSDGSAERVQSHEPRIKLVRNETNRGFAAACNQGAAHATGDVLVFLNQDTRVQPGWLAALVAGLDLKGVGLTTSKLLLMSQPGRINACGQEIHYTGLNSARGFLEAAPLYDVPCTVGAVAGASFAIRRALWEQLGGFDEQFFMYYEETDLCWRAALLGYQCLYVPTSVAYHDYRPGRASIAAIHYSKRNRCILLLKHWCWPTLLLLAPAFLLAELLDWGHAARLGRPALLAKARAWRDLLAHLPGTLRARRRVQATRRVSDCALLGSCAWRLDPREMALGGGARLGVTLCNLLFRLNYEALRAICRLAGLSRVATREKVTP